MYKILKVLLNIFTIIFSLLMITDIFLDKNISEEKVEYMLNTVKSTGGFRYSRSVSVIGIETNIDTYVLKDSSVYMNVNKGDQITLHKTKIFGEIRKIEHFGKVYNVPVYTAYSPNFLFPLICIGCSFGALLYLKTKNPMYEILLSASVFMTVYIIISMVTNNIF